MKSRTLCFVLILAAAGGLALQHFSANTLAQPAPGKWRVGIYDPRAIAVAYGGSTLNAERLKAKKAEMDQAKAANDQARVKELQEWGKSQQLRLHLQGFAGAAVDDILLQVRDKLPGVAADAGVDVIALQPDYVGPNATVVDVTDQLVRIFNPDARTLKMIAEVRRHKPEAIEKIAKMGDE